MFRSFELERAGSPDPLGIGSIRIFGSKTSRAREEVIELVPDRYFSYILLSGLPFRDYRADVSIEPKSTGGTIIRWSCRFDVDRPWTAWFWGLVMRRVLASTTSSLAKGAENPSIISTIEKHSED
jgi:hypothetical protein